MEYILVVALLFGLEKLYFIIADRFNIIDKPNERSSHSGITIRGGGIIFPISVLVWYLGFGFQLPWLLAGVLLIAMVSFIDDRFTIKPLPRLLVHLLSVMLVLVELGALSWPWYFWLIALVLIIGWLNAFNFMDGINGITVFYGLAVIAPIAWLNHENGILPTSLLTVMLIGLAVFAFFNARKKAKAFAGDVGSISLGLIIAYLMITMMIVDQSWHYILFVAIYGIDAVITIVQRLVKRENIFQAHRSHLYQYLANERKIPHVWVSASYALLQLLLSFGLILIGAEYSALYLAVIFIVLTTAYFPMKAWAKNGAVKKIF